MKKLSLMLIVVLSVVAVLWRTSARLVRRMHRKPSRSAQWFRLPGHSLVVVPRLSVATRLAVEAINAAGGVYVEEYDANLPINLTILDDESNPDNTVARLEELNEDGVVAYLGGFGSGLHAAAAAIAEKNGVPYMGVAFALYNVHQQGYEYLFSPFPKSPDLTSSTFALLDTIAEDDPSDPRRHRA